MVIEQDFESEKNFCQENFSDCVCQMWIILSAWAKSNWTFGDISKTLSPFVMTFSRISFIDVQYLHL